MFSYTKTLCRTRPLSGRNLFQDKTTRFLLVNISYKTRPTSKRFSTNGVACARNRNTLNQAHAIALILICPCFSMCDCININEKVFTRPRDPSLNMMAGENSRKSQFSFVEILRIQYLKTRSFPYSEAAGCH